MPIARDQDGSAVLRVKAVPGARKDEIVGPLGDRLKVRVSAPPEGGKANRAIRDLLARKLGLKPNAITLARGGSSPEKTFLIRGLPASALNDRWPSASMP